MSFLRISDAWIVDKLDWGKSLPHFKVYVSLEEKNSELCAPTWRWLGSSNLFGEWIVEGVL